MKRIADIEAAMVRHHGNVGAIMDRPSEGERLLRANATLDALISEAHPADRARLNGMRAQLVRKP